MTTLEAAQAKARAPGVGASSELYRFLRTALSRLRWATLLVLLLLALAEPTPSRVGLASWALVLLFAGYNLLVDLVRRRLPELRSFDWVAILDLPVAGLLYFAGGEPGGPLFVLFFLAVDSAAASMSLRGTLLYTAAAAVVVGLIEVVLREEALNVADVRALGIRVVTLGLVAFGMAILTERLILERDAIQTARDEAGRLGELDRLRADFVSTVSHDLRTPLTAVRAGLGLLEASGIDPLRGEQRELLSNARRNVERLNLLIDDLLAFNQLEAGTLHLDPQPVDLRRVVADAAASVEPLVRERGQRLLVGRAEPLFVAGDRRRLEQVLVNLLANASEHTPVNTRIEVSTRSAGAEILLSVVDDGPGVPREEQDAIFGRFYRLNPVEGGSGLGLAIARGIVQLHGGRVWVDSEPGQGATFWMALPRHETDIQD